MAARSCSFAASEKVLLRWSEDALSPSREEFVEMLEARDSEAVIQSTFRVVEETRVHLVGRDSTENGVVRSCRKSGEKFIVTIQINVQGPRPTDLDPGVLMIDSFMTEEQEARILDEVDEEIQRQQFRSLAMVKGHLNTGRCEGTAAVNRFVKFTVRSSTAMVSNGVVQFWDKFRQVAGTYAFGRTQTTASLPVVAAPASPVLPAPASGSIQ